jgi:hypothetical protein
MGWTSIFKPLDPWERAIAAISRDFTGATCSRHNALRVIVDFEKINGVRFNPLNPSHMHCVSGAGPHKEFIRKARAILSRHSQPPTQEKDDD